MLVYILFAIGFVFLIKGADLLVEGASSIGKKFKVSNLVIGLTIVSFGTSLPELLVNVISSLRGTADIGIGNILGSNIANILLILGVSALIFPLPIKRDTTFIEIPFSLTATLLVGFLANANLFSETKEFYINRADGLVLLFFFALFLGYVYIVSKRKVSEPISDDIQEIGVKKSLIYIALGLTGLFWGGKWVVEGAGNMASALGMSQSFIGLTVIAIGTSLPELITSATAAYKRNTDIAVGNVIGSNIFNLLWILGVSATIKPIPFDVISNSDIMMIIISSSALLLAVVIGKRPIISRWEGAFFLMIYIAYLVFLVYRG